MPTAFAHALVGASLAVGEPPDLRRRLAVGLAAAAMAPDLDSVGFWLGIPYGDPLGHRGFTHSLPFALLVGAIAPWILHPALRGIRRLRLSLLFALATASHGLLDAFTDGGLGIGFWIPFSDERFFAPVRPLMTSSLNPAHAFGLRGMRVLLNEALWIGVPVFLALVLRTGPWRRTGSRR